MKKLLLATTFITLALSSQAFAAATYGSDNARDTTDTTLNADTPAAGDDTTTTTTPTHHLRHTKTSATSGRHPNADAVPAQSEHMNDSYTSRQGEPSGETNGPVNGQSDDQNYGQPTNH